MAPLWDRLGELRMPVTVMAGERDAQYRALGERLAAALPARGSWSSPVPATDCRARRPARSRRRSPVRRLAR